VTATSEAPASFRSSSVRPSAFSLVQGGIREVLSRRRLIAYLVRADLHKKGSDTLLGNVWWFLDPLLQMLVYVIFVGIILQRGGSIEDYPLFVLAAILPWKWFDSTVKDGVASIVSRERLIKQIYFPKLVLPVSTTIGGVVSFAFGLVPLLVITAVAYPDRLSLWPVLVPIIMVVQFVFSLSIAVFISAANVFYRDVGNLVRHVLRMWFYLSPALYPADLVKELTKHNPILGDIFALNPWTVLFGAYRDLFYYAQAPHWSSLVILMLVSLGLTLIAIYLFRRAEPSFAKVL
jgi:homopolymeric O-antigen transport system permease protein